MLSTITSYASVIYFFFLNKVDYAVKQRKIKMLDAHASVTAHAHLTLFLWPRSASLPRPKHWNSFVLFF
jgi:hypothetical protein